MSMTVKLIIFSFLGLVISSCSLLDPCWEYREYDYQAEYYKSPYIDRVREDLIKKDTVPGDSITFDNEINVNMNRIYTNIEYPEVTRCLSVEGKNFFKVLINEQGYISKKLFDIRNRPILEDEGLNAIMKAQPFPIATVEGAPTQYWLTIPITFMLN